jgi:transcription antitermination factor NusG
MQNLAQNSLGYRTMNGNAHLSEDGEAVSRITSCEHQPYVCEPVRDRGPDIRVESNWFAVFTVSRHEKRVAQHFSQREVEHYLPLYRSLRKWRNGSKVVLDLPLFPGYIFVRIKRSERKQVLEVPGVLALVGRTAGEMTPLPEAEVDTLRSGLHLCRPEPYPLLTAGQRARIRSGALAGLEGIVVRKKNSLRIVLTLEIVMRSIIVEVDEEALESVDSIALNSPKGSILEHSVCSNMTSSTS